MKCLRCGNEAGPDETDEWDWECGHCGFLWANGSVGWGWKGFAYWSDDKGAMSAVPEGCLVVFNSEVV